MPDLEAAQSSVVSDVEESYRRLAKLRSRRAGKVASLITLILEDMAS